MATKPKVSQDRLERLREKVKGIKSGNAGFWSPAAGSSTVIRVLPEVGTMEYFYQQVGRHHFPPDGKKAAYCPDFTTEGANDCPVCSYVEELRSAGDVASKKMAEDLKVRRTYWMNIIVRGRIQNGQKIEDDTGPFIFTPGIKVMQAIATLISDSDYGDIMDVNEGRDITIKRVGEGLKTEYSVTPRANVSPLSKDPDLAEKWLAEAKDLTVVELTEDPDDDRALTDGRAVYIMPASRIISEFGLDSEAPLAEEEPEEEPAPKPTKSKPVVVPARRPARPAVETEEDTDEVVEEVDEEPAATREVARRKLARRAR